MANQRVRRQPTFSYLASFEAPGAQAGAGPFLDKGPARGGGRSEVSRGRVLHSFIDVFLAIRGLFIRFSFMRILALVPLHG